MRCEVIQPPPRERRSYFDFCDAIHRVEECWWRPRRLKLDSCQALDTCGDEATGPLPKMMQVGCRTSQRAPLGTTVLLVAFWLQVAPHPPAVQEWCGRMKNNPLEDCIQLPLGSWVPTRLFCLPQATLLSFPFYIILLCPSSVSVRSFVTVHILQPVIRKEGIKKPPTSTRELLHL